MNPFRLLIPLILAVVLFVLLPLSVTAQTGNDAFRFSSVTNGDIFASVTDLPDQSALLGMATGAVGLLALRVRGRQRRRHAGDAFTVTGPLRRLQPASGLAAGRTGNPVFAAPRLAITPRRRHRI